MRQQRVHALAVQLARVGGVLGHPRGQLGAVALHARAPQRLGRAAAAHAQLHEVRAVGRHGRARHQVAAGTGSVALAARGRRAAGGGGDLPEVRLHDHVRRLVLAGEDAQVGGRQQRADVVRRVADEAVGEELLGVVVAVERVQQRGAGGLRGAEARQQPARPAAAARRPHARRHPLVGPAAGVPERRGGLGRQVQHADHGLGDCAHQTLAHARQEAGHALLRRALVAVLHEGRHSACARTPLARG